MQINIPLPTTPIEEVGVVLEDNFADYVWRKAVQANILDPVRFPPVYIYEILNSQTAMFHNTSVLLKTEVKSLLSETIATELQDKPWSQEHELFFNNKIWAYLNQIYLPLDEKIVTYVLAYYGPLVLNLIMPMEFRIEYVHHLINLIRESWTCY